MKSNLRNPGGNRVRDLIHWPPIDIWKAVRPGLAIPLVVSVLACHAFSQSIDSGTTDMALHKVVTVFYRAGVKSNSVGLSFDLVGKERSEGWSYLLGVSASGGNVVNKVKLDSVYSHPRSRQLLGTVRVTVMPSLNGKGYGPCVAAYMTGGKNDFVEFDHGDSTFSGGFFGFGSEQGVISLPVMKHGPAFVVAAYEEFLFGSQMDPPWNVGIKVQAGYQW
jgi:hypothetical protein